MNNARFLHTMLRVRDLDRSVAFYTGLLGMKELRRNDPDAKLSGAQHAIAREHGFASWPQMKAYLDRLQAHPDGLQFAYHEDLDYYEERADGLCASAEDRTSAAVAVRGKPTG